MPKISLTTTPYRRILATTLAFFTFAGLHAASRAEPPLTPRQKAHKKERLYKKANDEVRKGNYTRAIALYDAALEFGEDNLTHLGLARAYRKNGKCREAQVHYQHSRRAPLATGITLEQAQTLVEDDLAKMRQGCAALRVTCSPSDMSLDVDGASELLCDEEALFVAGPHVLRGRVRGREITKQLLLDIAAPTTLALDIPCGSDGQICCASNTCGGNAFCLDDACITPERLCTRPTFQGCGGDPTGNWRVAHICLHPSTFKVSPAPHCPPSTIELSSDSTLNFANGKFTGSGTTNTVQKSPLACFGVGPGDFGPRFEPLCPPNSIRQGDVCVSNFSAPIPLETGSYSIEGHNLQIDMADSQAAEFCVAEGWMVIAAPADNGDEKRFLYLVLRRN